MDALRKKKIVSWSAVIISALFANLWAFWGIVENFHEGWYFKSFWDNVLMMFGQYLLMPIAFMLLAYASIKWNKLGAVLHLILAFGAYLLFGEMDAGFLLVVLPLVGLALFYWFSSLQRKKLAHFLVLGLPLLQIIFIGTYLTIKVYNRYYDGDFSARQIKGNGVELVWAPQGLGWPERGKTWFEANYICAHLTEDGKALSDSALNIWRLPTIEEAVRSQVYHGKNAGGTWNNKTKTAYYSVQPDKESPLWNVYSRTIYWWTSTEVSEKQARIIVYNGFTPPRIKNLKVDYLSFRAVKEIKKNN